VSDQPRNWDQELAAIDKVIASGTGAPSSVPAPRGGGAAPAPGGGARPPSRRKALTTWVRVALGVALIAAVLQWPYAHRCGLGLMLYLGSAATVAVAGIWAMVVSWHRRQGWAHLVGLALFLAGLGLVAAVVLPRIGYAVGPLPWMCG
jgi:hypothetical protein